MPSTPSMDRFWRIGLVFVMFLAAASLAPLVFFVISMVPLNRELGLPPFDGLGLGDVFQLLYVGSLVLPLLSWSLGARRRARRRARAMTGDPDAVPLAWTQPNLAAATNLSSNVLVLGWRFMRTPHAVLLSVAILVILPATTLGSLFLLIWAGVRSPFLVLGVPVAFLLASLVAYGSLMRRRAPAKRIERLTATTYGLTWERTGRRSREIPWHDALLLEVWMQRRSRSADRVCGYSLFGRAATIEWSLLAPDSIAPEDIWYAELEQRQRELLDVIATRTRLALRTFAADLQEPEAARPPTRFSQILTFVMFGALCLLIFGGLLGLAAAALILPISNFTQLNALTAGALALASAYFVVFLVVVIAKLRRQRTFDANYPLPSLSEEAETIEEEAGLRYRARPMVRAQFIFCGLLLAWQIIPVCLAIFRPLTAPTSSQRHDLQTWVLGGLTFCTFCGLACIWAALRDHRTDIWADGEGLHERDGRRARFLPLETVQMVQVETIAGKVDAFRVTGAASVIWWPADDVRIMPPRDHDARALTPDELAAVVVTRSGRSLTVS